MAKDVRDSGTVKCENCGAEINIHDSKCPFCGYINLYGAEEKYMQDMHDIKSKLAGVDDEQIEVIKGESKRGLKIVIITIVSVVCVAAAIIAVLMIRAKMMEKHYEDLGVYETDPLEAAKWNDIHLQDMDAMYEAGNIDELVDYYAKLEANGDIGAFNSWEHSFVITQIYNLRFWTKYLEDGSEVDELALHQIMFNILYYYNGDYKGTNMPEEDYDKILAEVESDIDLLNRRFGITEEQIDKMNGECIGDYGYIDPEKVSRYCDKHKKMFR